MKRFFERMASGNMRAGDDLHAILDALPIALSWATMPHGNIQFVNRAFTKTFGYGNGVFDTIDQWIDTTYAKQEDRDGARARWQTFWSADVSSGITEIEPFELEIRCADGQTVTAIHRGILLHEYRMGLATFEDISLQKSTEHALKRIAYEDPLTGLNNRRALQKNWDSALSGSTSEEPDMIALLMVDLDNFKPINDAFGHDGGDAILKSVATRLQRSVRHTDTVVRMGGDEFAVLLTGLKDIATAEKVCRRMTAAFSKPFTIQGRQVTVRATMGVSLYPQHAKTLDKLLQAADQALYKMKRLGKNNWVWFEPPVDEPDLRSTLSASAKSSEYADVS